MATPDTSVTLQLDKARVLSFDNAALRHFRVHCKVSPFKAALDMFEGRDGERDLEHISFINEEYLTAFLWAGLLADDPTLTEAAVDAMVFDFCRRSQSYQTAQYVLADQVFDALVKAGLIKLPKPEEQKKDEGADDEERPTVGVSMPPIS